MHSSIVIIIVFINGLMNWKTTTMWQFSTRISEKRLIVYRTGSLEAN